MNHEKNNVQAAEKKVQELKSAIGLEESRFQRTILEYKFREEGMSNDLLRVQSERDSLLLQVSSYRSDYDEATRRLSDMTRSRDEIRSELENSRIRLLEAEAAIQRTEATSKALIAEANNRLEEAAKKEELAASVSRETALTMQQLQEKEAELRRAAEAAERASREDERQRTADFQERLNEIIRSLEAERSARAEAQSQIYALQKQLQDERTDAAALRLRLQLMDPRAPQQQHQQTSYPEGGAWSVRTPLPLTPSYEPTPMSTRMPSPGFPPGPHSSTDFSRPPLGGNYQQSYLQRLSETDGAGAGGGPDSPLFSEDLGPASFPASPLPRTKQRGDQAYEKGGDSHQQQQQLEDPEKEQLKNIVREVSGNLHCRLLITVEFHLF